MLKPVTLRVPGQKARTYAEESLDTNAINIEKFTSSKRKDIWDNSALTEIDYISWKHTMKSGKKCSVQCNQKVSPKVPHRASITRWEFVTIF